MGFIGFPGKKTRHFLLQGILLTQGSNLCLLHILRWQACSLHLPAKPPLHSEMELKPGCEQ